MIGVPSRWIVSPFTSVQANQDGFTTLSNMKGLVPESLISNLYNSPSFASGIPEKPLIVAPIQVGTVGTLLSTLPAPRLIHVGVYTVSSLPYCHSSGKLLLVSRDKPRVLLFFRLITLI